MAKKISPSSLILISFTLVLGISATISELFRAPKPENHYNPLPKSLFFQENLHSATKIQLKNRLGEFHFEKSDKGWEIILPRRLPTRERPLNFVFKTLKNIRIKKVYPKDNLTLSSFSLDNPVIEITLIHQDGDRDEIKFGMIDSISSSTYLMLSDSSWLYQVDLLDYPLERLDLADFINPKIFTQSPDNIASLKIYRRGQLKLQLTRKNKDWWGKRGRKLKTTLVNKYIKDLTQLKSNVILDEMSTKVKDRVDSYLTSPLFKIEIQDRSKITYTYNISTVINSLPDIKIEKSQSFIISASNRKHPYLLNKKYLRFFSKREKSF
jgi:hypothetical protein